MREGVWHGTGSGAAGSPARRGSGTAGGPAQQGSGTAGVRRGRGPARYI